MPDSDPPGWEHLPSALRMAAKSGRVNPKYTTDRKNADAALSAALQSSVEERNSGPRYNWDRNTESSQRQLETDQEERRKSLREEAEAMRRRLEQLDGKISSVTTTTTSRASSSPIKSKSMPVARVTETKPSHDAELLRKKLKKVDKMIAKETPGTKEYKKLQKKRAEYQSQLDDMSES
ncbi:MAG: hypothetical protein SGARI_006105, partial [Bacillariaceae sp.]